MASDAEILLGIHLHERGLTFEREFKFCQSRKWRADFAIPAFRLLIEVDGGIWKNGRHNRASGYLKDLEKLNQAVVDGWRVLRFSTEMVMDGRAIETICAAIALT